VKYIYDEISTEEANPYFDLVLTSNTLKVMPEQWIRKFYNAAIEADKVAVIELIDQIPEKNLARSLTKLARSFAFEKLIDLAEPLLPS
jgi:hypothetical protein